MSDRVTAAVFDVDRTLVPGTSMEQLFLVWLLRRGCLGPLKLARMAVGVAVRLPEARRRGYLAYHGYLAGYRESEIADWAGQCFAERIAPRVSRAGVHCLAEHRATGHLTVLLSGSIPPLVNLLAAQVGADLALCTEPEVKNGRYTGRLTGGHVSNEGKVGRVLKLSAERGVDLAASYCYADHRSDLPMLERFGHPIPTNPDHVLAQVARERGWPIRQFA